MEVKRGNVSLVDLNPVVGTEQAGIRPALVVQTDRANVTSPHTIIIPFTTRIKETILPSHVKIPAEVGGLTEDSILLCYHHLISLEEILPLWQQGHLYWDLYFCDSHSSPGDHITNCQLLSG